MPVAESYLPQLEWHGFYRGYRRQVSEPEGEKRVSRNEVKIGPSQTPEEATEQRSKHSCSKAVHDPIHD